MTGVGFDPPQGTPEEICEANGHDFDVDDTDENGEPLYALCAELS